MGVDSSREEESGESEEDRKKGEVRSLELMVVLMLMPSACPREREWEEEGRSQAASARQK